jgi:hypothetical protein
MAKMLGGTTGLRITAVHRDIDRDPAVAATQDREPAKAPEPDPGGKEGVSQQ